MSPPIYSGGGGPDIIKPPTKAATTLKSPAVEWETSQVKVGTKSQVSSRYGKDTLLRDMIKNKRQGQFLHQNWHYIKLRKNQIIKSRFDADRKRVGEGKGCVEGVNREGGRLQK